MGIIITIVLIVISLVIAVARTAAIHYFRELFLGKSGREILSGKTEEEMYFEEYGEPCYEERKRTRIFMDHD